MIKDLHNETLEKLFLAVNLSRQLLEKPSSLRRIVYALMQGHGLEAVGENPKQNCGGTITLEVHYGFPLL